MNKRDFETRCNLRGEDIRLVKSAWAIYQVLIARKEARINEHITFSSLKRSANFGSVNTVKNAGKLLLDLSLINDEWEIVNDNL